MEDQRSDDVVVSKIEAAKMLNISTWTLDRMFKRGEGPRRTRLSDRRVGYRLREIRQYERLEEAV